MQPVLTTLAALSLVACVQVNPPPPAYAPPAATTAGPPGATAPAPDVPPATTIPGEPTAALPVAAEPSIEPADLALYHAINAYRAGLGLTAVPWSRALTHVARTHVDDIVTNRPVGGDCNQHSWSDNPGVWSGCCYTRDHAQSRCMWDKARELTAYEHTVFEVAVAGTKLTPELDVKIWDGSPSHRAVIVNADIWTTPWQALGCAHSDTQAVCWFGEQPDVTAP